MYDAQFDGSGFRSMLLVVVSDVDDESLLVDADIDPCEQNSMEHRDPMIQQNAIRVAAGQPPLTFEEHNKLMGRECDLQQPIPTNLETINARPAIGSAYPFIRNKHAPLRQARYPSAGHRRFFGKAIRYANAPPPPWRGLGVIITTNNSVE